MTDFHFQKLFEMDAEETTYRKLEGDFVSEGEFEGQRILKVDGAALTALAADALLKASAS